MTHQNEENGSQKTKKFSIKNGIPGLIQKRLLSLEKKKYLPKQPISTLLINIIFLWLHKSGEAWIGKDI
jgi:hypothetical protein